MPSFLYFPRPDWIVLAKNAIQSCVGRIHSDSCRIARPSRTSSSSRNVVPAGRLLLRIRPRNSSPSVAYLYVPAAALTKCVVDHRARRYCCADGLPASVFLYATLPEPTTSRSLLSDRPRKAYDRNTSLLGGGRKPGASSGIHPTHRDGAAMGGAKSSGGAEEIQGVSFAALRMTARTER